MLNRIVIYTKKTPDMVTFYCDHFGFDVLQIEGDRITELVPRKGGARIMLHAAAKSQKMGQALVKLGFEVDDVLAKRDQLMQAGLTVGSVHDGGGYIYANLKDPSGNSVMITNRHLVTS